MGKSRSGFKKTEARYIKIVGGYKILPTGERRVKGWVLERVDEDAIRLAYYQNFSGAFIITDMYRKEITRRFDYFSCFSRFIDTLDDLSIQTTGKRGGIYVSEEILKVLDALPKR